MIQCIVENDFEFVDSHQTHFKTNLAKFVFGQN